MSSPGSPPFPSLVEEHRLLTLAVGALRVLANRLDATAPAGPQPLGPQDDALVEDLARFVKILNEFGEGLHHVKEEDVLLPALARAGFAWDAGPLAFVRKDHDQERYLVRVLEQAATQQERWSREDRRHAVAAARAFVDFLSEHIRKEDEVLMPAVRERLSEEQIAAVDAELAEFDRKNLPDDARANLATEVEALASRYPAS